MKLFILMFLYGVFVIAVKSVWQIPVHFVMLAVIYLGFYQGWRIGLLCTLMLGILLDAVSVSSFGTSLLSFGILFGWIRFFRNKILFQTPLSHFFWVAFLSLLHGVITLGLSRSLNVYRGMLFWHAVLDAAVGLFWIPLLSRYTAFTTKELVEEKDIFLKR